MGYAAGREFGVRGPRRRSSWYGRRFEAGFSGSERMVAEYLLAEVLDLLTGGSGGVRVLQDLEEANAFVVSLDAARSWFRHHHLFADLLQLELRRTEPGAKPRPSSAPVLWACSHRPRTFELGENPPDRGRRLHPAEYETRCTGEQLPGDPRQGVRHAC